MGVESATHILELDSSLPAANDLALQGDDHMRLIKAVLLNSLWASRAISSSTTLLATDAGKTLMVDTTSGAVELTMPSLSSGDAGWETTIMKTNTGSSPIFIKRGTGNVLSGDYTVARARRSIPRRKFTVTWDGTNWYVGRIETAPVGSVHPAPTSGLPVGYLQPDGSTVTDADTLYPEWYAANGSSAVLVDLRGRTFFGLNDFGTAAGATTRLQAGFFGSSASTVKNVGGNQSVTLVTANLPAHNHEATVTDPGHFHRAGDAVLGGSLGGSGMRQNTGSGSAANTDTKTTGITVQIANTGDGTAFSIIPPAMIVNYYVVME